MHRGTFLQGKHLGVLLVSQHPFVTQHDIAHKFFLRPGVLPLQKLSSKDVLQQYVDLKGEIAGGFDIIEGIII